MINKPGKRITKVLRWSFSLLTFFTFFGTMPLTAQIDTDDHNLAVDLIYKADTLIANQQYEQAIENLKHSISLDSMIREQYILLTRACFYSRQLATAKKYLRKAKLIFREDDELCYYLGKVYGNEMNVELAVAEYDSAIVWSKVNGSDFPIVYDYYASRGQCYLQLSKYQEALDDFDTALTYNDSKASILMWRGVALYHLNKKDEACNSWEEALAKGMQQAEIYLNQNCK